MTTQLQTVLDALTDSQPPHYSNARKTLRSEAIAIVRGMMEAEPVAWLSVDCIGERYLCFTKPLDNDPVTALYPAPQAVPAGKPKCKECAKWVKEQADNKEWIDGVAEGRRIVEKLVAKELSK